MASPKRLNFSEVADDDAAPSSRKNSQQRKRASVQADEETPKKSKKKKSASGVIKRIWSEDDELAILKGLASYRVKTRSDPKIDWEGFFNSVQGSLHANVSKEQLLSKTRKLKRKFIVHMERINQGKDPPFTRFTDSQAFGYAHMVWGQNEPNGGMQVPQRTASCEDEQMNVAEPVIEDEAEKMKITAGNEAELPNKGMEKVQQTMNGDDEPMENDEPVNENGAVESKFDGIFDKRTECHDDDDDDSDEFYVIQDAFETMISQGLSSYQKKLQLEKLMNVGTEKRNELSSEWKAICAEERRLNIKKLRFSAKLAEAMIDG